MYYPGAWWQLSVASPLATYYKALSTSHIFTTTTRLSITKGSCSAYYGGFHSELRSAVTLDVGKYVERERNTPEQLSCPNFCRVIVLDDAGEWRKSNPVFMADMTLSSTTVHVVYISENRIFTPSTPTRLIIDQILAGLQL